jgi:hypothetical protein
MALKITNQLIHLPNEIHISRVQTHEHSYEIFIDFPAPQQRICPCCGSSGCPRNVGDIPRFIGVSPTFLVLLLDS